MRKAFLLVSLMFWFLVVSTAAQPSVFRPLATIRQIHDAMITPASDAIFNTGLQAPKTDQEWTAVRNAAVMLAESGNLLMLGSRVKDRGTWMKLSRAFVDAAAAGMKAAEAKNLGALMQASDRIVIVCETCHEPYRDRGRKMPVN